MSLNFTPTNYVDGETVITAQNLNDIQEAIQDLDENKVEAVSGKGLSTNDYSNEEKAKVDSALQSSALQPYRTAAAQDVIDDEQDSEIASKASALDGVYFGTCETIANISAKTATVQGITELTEGTKILVHFQNADYAAQPTLNVNDLGAKNIQSIRGTNASTYQWLPNEVLLMVFSNDAWVIVDGGLATTSFYGKTKLATTATSSSTAMALTPNSLNQLVENMIAGYPIYSSFSQYAVGDRVRHDYKIWSCTVAITTTEAWTEAHWTPLKTLIELIDDNAASRLPTGGTDGDVLVKNGAADYAAKWTNTAKLMGNLARINATSAAETTYYKGDYLVYNGQLYKVTADTISQGVTLTPGGNIQTAVVCERDIEEYRLNAESGVFDLHPNVELVYRIIYTRKNNIASLDVMFKTTSNIANGTELFKVSNIAPAKSGEVFSLLYSASSSSFCGGAALTYVSGAQNQVRFVASGTVSTGNYIRAYFIYIVG